MSSKTNKSTQNQGPKLGNASTRGKVSKNPMKPKLAAKIKNSQGIGGGLQQGKGGAKYVTSARPGRGINQSYGTASKRVSGGKGKTNLRPTKAQPKGPKNNSIQPKNNFSGHNTVTSGDVARIQKASSMPSVKVGGGNFRSLIGGN